MPTRPPFPEFRVFALPPTPPLEIAGSPRPWMIRRRGQCAFPVAGEGRATLACCNPCGEGRYCPAHRTLMLRPEA